MSLTLGNRERGGKVMEDELTLKAVVREKLAQPVNPLPSSITLRTRARAATQEESAAAIEIPIDVVSFPTSELTSAANVFAVNATGCLAGRILWANGGRAWLTVSHLLKFPGGATVNALTTRDGVRLPRAKGALWLQDPLQPGYPIDATAVVEEEDMQRYAAWTAAKIDSKIWTQQLNGLRGFYFVDQKGEFHALRYHTTCRAGIVQFTGGGYYPLVHLFQSDYAPYGGDSGGPVWLEYQQNQYLVGIQSGVTEGNFIVIPIDCVSRAFRNAGVMSGIWFKPLS
ncbi:hypothetical protein [Desulfatibacillum alkenivorans]|uniref:hypothetical protein n=1 Tax=Desulfatibacillum alkenivorans TaxID=259354 RepID=UPI0011149D16|nr:hypothetical protein [Desulfatibacillum alkenivorans]